MDYDDETWSEIGEAAMAAHRNSQKSVYTKIAGWAIGRVIKPNNVTPDQEALDACRQVPAIFSHCIAVSGHKDA
jgi:hypothetical protein